MEELSSTARVTDSVGSWSLGGAGDDRELQGASWGGNATRRWIHFEERRGCGRGDLKGEILGEEVVPGPALEGTF
jgi:hypothetical protein